MKRFIALLLVVFMISGMFVACDEMIFTPDPEETGRADDESEKSTDDETEKPTEAPTEKPTESPTEKPTESPTEKPTESPTEKPTDAPTNGGSSENTPPKEFDELGKERFTSAIDVDSIDFGGKTLTVLHRDDIRYQREWYKKEADIVDELDTVIAMRNECVKGDLNLNVGYVALSQGGYQECLSDFTVAIQADHPTGSGLNQFDIVANYAYAGADAQVRDLIANLNDKETFPYFDFKLPCWNQTMVKELTVNNKLYYITGDLNLSTFDKTIAVFLNKTQYNAKKGAVEGAADDLQDLAIAGNNATGGFTYEELYKWASLYEDTDSDGVDDCTDFHAISAGFESVPIDAFPYAWDLGLIKTEADGKHSYNIEGNTKADEALTKIKNILSETVSEGVCNANETSGCILGGYSEPIMHFANDRSVFTLHFLYCTDDDNMAIRRMSSEIGLLPMPKYDAEQKNYGTTAHDSYTLMTVIDHSASAIPTKGEMISAFLQYSTEEAYINVRSYYIDRIVKTMYFGQSDSVTKSVKIFNIIAANLEFDFFSVYSPQLNNIFNNCWRYVATGYEWATGSTPAEAFANDKTTYVEALNHLDTWLFS